MSSYVNAPATKMLASHCAACGRPLVDAESVELGIGPDCRKRLMVIETGLSEEAHAEANRIVYEIALRQGGPEVLPMIARVREIGYYSLADAITDRLVKIEIKDWPDGKLAVKAPYNEGFIEATRRLPGRWWVANRKVTLFAQEAKQGLWTALKQCYPGMLALGPKGFFSI